MVALVSPPRTHRHRYFGVLAPNSPLRVAVTALAQAAPVYAPCRAPLRSRAKHSPAHYLWAALIARL